MNRLGEARLLSSGKSFVEQNLLDDSRSWGSRLCGFACREAVTPRREFDVLNQIVDGHRELVKEAELVAGDMEDTALLERIFSAHTIEAVMHFAAYCYVGESVTDPAKYYQNNVASTLNLLKVMNRFGVKKFIFSAAISAAPHTSHK